MEFERNSMVGTVIIRVHGIYIYVKKAPIL
jgi:hypothetical protein